MIKVSFRKGGDKAFYAVLRRSLLDKAWEVSVPCFCRPRTSGVSARPHGKVSC